MQALVFECISPLMFGLGDADYSALESSLRRSTCWYLDCDHYLDPPESVVPGTDGGDGGDAGAMRRRRRNRKPIPLKMFLFTFVWLGLFLAIAYYIVWFCF